ncbi:uncharacterized protein LOC144657575 isoform X2 [Oculina patagonica]
MALKESELRILALLGLVILILWSFFGLFWSLLLVFTFLIYAYNFGKHRPAKVRFVQERRDDEHDLSYQEKLHNNYYEPPDLPFTGLPREKSSLRSPKPLLSEVTKRLSFNMSSTITPLQARKSWYNRERGPTPYPSRGSALTHRRKPNNFSLLNPALQRPSTVKIASPDVTVNRTFTLSNSPLKRTAEDWNPCSRVTVLSALKESRKRSFLVEDYEDELTRPTKRRDTKPVDSYPFSSPLLGGRKRVATLETTETTADENSSKKSKVIDHSTSSEILHSQKQTDPVVQKRKDRAVETVAADVHEESAETEVEETSKKRSKVIDHNKSSETVPNQRHTESVAVPKRKDRARETETTNCDVKDDDEGSKSKKAKNLEPQKEDKDIQRENSEQAKKDDSCIQKQKKRFTVPRFASKEDSRRRAVPVYCASNEESEMPQRRTVSRKINQEQIKIDRRLAWERVKELLDGDEDDEEEEGASKPGTTAVSSAAETTSTSTSLFKIPTAGAVTSTGTITTTTTQSLITPIPATGGPQGATGAQKVPTTITNVLQSQSSTVPSLQSQQAFNLSSIPGSSTGLPSTLTGVPQTATLHQAQPVVAASTPGGANLTNASTIGSRATVPLTTASASQGATGFQLLSSASSFGNSPFTKPATANQLTSLSDLTNKNTPDTNTSSAPKTGYSFPVISSGTSGTLSNATAAGPGGLNFAAASGTQSAFSLGQNATQKTSGTSSINSPSTFNLGASTAQKPVALAGNSLTANTQSPFGSIAKPTQSNSLSSASSTPSVFGQSANTTQGSLGSTAQKKITFGATNMQPVLGQQGQSPFGSAPSNASGFGATQNAAFGTTVNKSSTQSPFSFGAQANQNATQSATGTNPVQNAFGVQKQNQQAAPSVFGQTNKQTSDKGGFSFGSQVKQNTTPSVFGNQATQNMFGSQPNQNASQSTFGTKPAQNAFGAQATQNAFGAPANQKPASTFSFAANTAQNPSSSPFGGFGNKAGTQSTFGAAPSQNAAAPSGGFNFAAPGSNSTPGGFNFNAAANKPAGFQFGASGGGSAFGQFGQTTAQPGAAPATPTPSGGFNFAAGSGGMPGSPFASPAAAPTFGAAPSTPQGAGSTLTNRTRARIAARRRGKK